MKKEGGNDDPPSVFKIFYDTLKKQLECFILKQKNLSFFSFVL